MRRYSRFTWTRPEFLLEVTGAPRGRKVLRLDLENLIGPGTALTVEDADGRPLDRLRLEAGRQLHHLVGLPEVRTFTLRLRCAGRVPEALRAGDDRDLALKLYDLSIHPTRTAGEILESDCWTVPSGSLDAFTVELTARCNLKCGTCPQVVGRPYRPRNLSPELLEREIPWSAHAATVALHGVGEPLLFPGLADVLRRLEPRGPRAFLSTNGTILTDEHLEALLSGQVREVSFSLDAATPETFRRIRGANLETVLRNIRRLVAERRARSLAHPQVSLNMTLTQVNLDEAPLLVELAAGLGADRVWFWHLNHDLASNGWTVERNGFVFDYRSQSALADPARAGRGEPPPGLPACLPPARRGRSPLGIRARAARRPALPPHARRKVRRPARDAFSSRTAWSSRARCRSGPGLAVCCSTPTWARHWRGRPRSDSSSRPGPIRVREGWASSHSRSYRPPAPTHRSPSIPEERDAPSGHALVATDEPRARRPGSGKDHPVHRVAHTHQIAERQSLFRIERQDCVSGPTRQGLQHLRRPDPQPAPLVEQPDLDENDDGDVTDGLPRIGGRKGPARLLSESPGVGEMPEQSVRVSDDACHHPHHVGAGTQTDGASRPGTPEASARVHPSESRPDYRRGLPADPARAALQSPSRLRGAAPPAGRATDPLDVPEPPGAGA